MLIYNLRHSKMINLAQLQYPPTHGMSLVLSLLSGLRRSSHVFTALTMYVFETIYLFNLCETGVHIVKFVSTCQAETNPNK